MRDDLKPCPFCGGKAERITIAEPGDNYGGDVICCTRCGASSHVEFGRKENLVDHWNRRPEPVAAEPAPDQAQPIDEETLVERIVEAVIDSANLVAHDGYCEIDQESACRAILPIIREHLK